MKIALSLVSHTNAGKTTLARTLLARDVGEVRDAPHVTEFADPHLLLKSPEGDELTLWDTPGFGDSARLARRMQQSANPIGWLLSEVWDRWRDRPFWASQQALRNVREQADVVLYLVNASEMSQEVATVPPAAPAYVAPEIALLAWLGKPVLVLLNQLGAPRERAAEEAEVQRWRALLAPHALVQTVLPMDAFARCWVQEAELLRDIEQALPADRQAAMQRLAHAWGEQRQATFGAAITVLAQSLARTALATQTVEEGGWLDRARRAGGLVGIKQEGTHPADRAQQKLAQAAQEEVRQSTAALLLLHQIEGRAEGEILQRVATLVQVHQRVDEGGAALLGGMVSGALVGLKADIATGGLTLGGGLLAGGVLGALGAAGLARGANVVRGTGKSWLGWQPEALTPMLHAALLRYLAVAHFGRGRGQWAEGEAPAHWQAVVEAACAPHHAALEKMWPQRGRKIDDARDADSLAAELQPLMAKATQQVLAALYPYSSHFTDSAGAKSPA